MANSLGASAKMDRITRKRVVFGSMFSFVILLLFLCTGRAQEQSEQTSTAVETAVSVDGRALQEVSENPGGYIDETASGQVLTNGDYPSTTLSCYSSYTKPDGQSICPESRSKYCVKELSTLKQDLCGQSQYFGDEYLDNLCVLRKCAATCEEGQYPFVYAGLTYVRVRYCCQANYCNSSPKTVSFSIVVMLVCVVASVCLLF